MARLLFSFLTFVVSSAPLLSYADSEFSIPKPGVALSFPRDHGAHQDFKTEWWYLTASLAAEDRDVFKDGTDFGLQLTFFRHALARSKNSTEWTQQYLAHGAVMDRSREKFVFEKRYVRGGVGIATGSKDSLAITQGDWKLAQREEGLELVFDVTKDGATYSVNLNAKILPQEVLHGLGGFSKKGDCPECASFYYSIPRIELTGEVVRDGVHIKVKGLGWLDHEWMSGAIDPSQVGWDWFGLMTREGRSIMAFQLRDAAGKRDFASATVIEGDRVIALREEDFTLTTESVWKSAATGANYPNKWRLSIPVARIDLLLAPVIANQELTGEGQQYWEGAVRSEDSSAVGYGELTGYVKPVGRF